MEKVLVDVEVIKGILNAYTRADKNQSRIYGIILGTKKDNIYHITDVIYGYIFEDGEDPKTHKKKFTRLNDESIKSILNSLHQKFNISSNSINTPYSKGKIREKQEKDSMFKTQDVQMILGGFATDRELFNDLHNLYSTIDLINDSIIKNINSILLLVDPNFKDEKEVKYGIKTYNWSIKSLRIKNNEYNRLLFFKEIDNEVVKHIHNVEILKNIKNKYLWEKILNLNIDKNEKRNINELLFDLNDKEDNLFVPESNVEYIKNKIKECLLYLNIFEKILENDEEKNKDYTSIVNEDDYNKISYILSQLEPMLDDNEIIKAINNDIDKKYNIDSLSQLLEVQLTLSDKIRQLIN